MTTWFTADTHFNHALMADLRGFGPDVKRHDQALIDAWNSRVKPGDVVYHLGDFSLKQTDDEVTATLRKLNGTKQLIRGNHDDNKVTRNKGWAWVGWMKSKRIEGQPFILSHYALRTWPGAPNDHADRTEGFRWNLHGHSHASLPSWDGQMDVGVDTRTDWGPWDFDTIAALLGAE